MRDGAAAQVARPVSGSLGQTSVVEVTGRTIDEGAEPAIVTVCVPGGRSSKVATPWPARSFGSAVASTLPFALRTVTVTALRGGSAPGSSDSRSKATLSGWPAVTRSGTTARTFVSVISRRRTRLGGEDLLHLVEDELVALEVGVLVGHAHGQVGVERLAETDRPGQRDRAVAEVVVGAEGLRA